MSAISMVIDELNRATAKFPTWPTDPLHALAILDEEFGELNKAVLQLTYEPHKSSQADVLMEAIQTAAMALRFVAGLPFYRYGPSGQYAQGQAAVDVSDLARGVREVQDLFDAACALASDPLLRADIDSDGVRVVNASDSQWGQFKRAINSLVPVMKEKPEEEKKA